MNGLVPTGSFHATKESTMSDSLVFVHSRLNDLHIAHLDEIPYSDDPSPLMLLAVDIINAGYVGIAIDVIKLNNGRCVYSMDTNNTTPEGYVIEKLRRSQDEGRPLPDLSTVLEAIRSIYKKCEQYEQSQQPNDKENF
jgi:hypothetical protein